MRGYERTAVDEFLQHSSDQISRLQNDLAESERRRVQAEQHATATEGENRTLRSEQPSPNNEEGFGYRAEKLLRLAEQEAVDVRTSATREASALLEKARADAEQHRHEVEQTLISRSALLDQQASQRSVELQERELQIAAQLTAAQSEVEAIHEAAGRSAEQQRQQAEAEAAAVRARAAQEARRMRDQAEQEVARLGGLRDGARSEINRLAELLRSGLGPIPEQNGRHEPSPRPGNWKPTTSRDAHARAEKNEEAGATSATRS